MTLRPLRPTAEDDADAALDRMAPGGRRWSESPVPRAGTRRVRALKKRTPLYWYWFDDAAGSVLVESGGGPSFNIAAGGGHTFQANPVQWPDSVYSFRRNAAGSTVIASYPDGLAAGADGLLTFDFFIRYTDPDASWYSDTFASERTLFAVRGPDVASAVGFELSLCSEAGPGATPHLRFYSAAAQGGQWVSTLTDDGLILRFDNPHIDLARINVVWSTNLATGASTVTLKDEDGIVQATGSATLTWDWPTTEARIYLGGANGDFPWTDHDELKIYGRAAA